MRIVRAAGLFLSASIGLACRAGDAAGTAAERAALARGPGDARPAPQAPPAAAPKPDPAGAEHVTPEKGVGLVLMQADRPDEPCKPMKGPVRLNFDNAPIPNVIREASRWSCRNFAFTAEVARGEISVVSEAPVSTEEAYVQLGAALQANNIAMYRNGKYYNLVRITDAKKTPIPTLVDDAEETPATQQPVTRVVRLRYADAEPMKKVLSNFLSPAGADIQAIPPDLLIVTDVGLNLRRVELLIREIDQPGRDRQRWTGGLEPTATVVGDPAPAVR